MLGLIRDLENIFKTAEGDLNDIFVQKKMLWLFVGEDYHERFDDCISKFSLLGINELYFVLMRDSNRAVLVSS